MFTPLRTLFTQARDRSLALQECDQISPRELHDLGLSREQLNHLLSLPADLPERVSAMAAVFGLTSAGLQQNKAAWADMLQCCGQCDARAHCAKSMSQPDMSRAKATSFCPNAPKFAAQSASTAKAST